MHWPKILWKIRITEFPLTSSSFAAIDETPHLEITKLHINDIEQSIPLHIKTDPISDNTSLKAKSGYTNSHLYSYTGELLLTPEKQNIINVEYTTIVPINYTSFSCRLSCPSHKFSFRFRLIGQNIENYNLNLKAFGFIDDGSSTPNHHDDDPSVSVSLEDWVFPCDGVSVELTQKII